jgi:N-acetylneuraminate synthase
MRSGVEQLDRELRTMTELAMPSRRPFMIAEIALTHDGSLGTAHAFIDAAAQAGADAVKFQTHIATAESTFDEPFRIAFSRQDAKRYDYWCRTAFSAEQWQELASHAKELGVTFLSSPFSVEAVHLLSRLGVALWKVPSGELRSRDLLEAMLETERHILVSTGMSPWQEIDEIVALLRSRAAEFTLMQCTSRYPTPLSEVGLNVLEQMRKRYSCPVGLSDHSGTPFPSLAAMARGASVIEIHVTFDRRMFGPDVPASITFDELAFLARARDAFDEMDVNPVDKDAMANSLASMRQIFGRSLAPSRALCAGTLLVPGMLVSRKPGGGIPMDAMQEVMGWRLTRDVVPERILRWDDLEKVAE